MIDCLCKKLFNLQALFTGNAKVPMSQSGMWLIAFVRKHYIPEGGQNISTAKCDTILRMTPFMYIYKGDSIC